MRAGACQSFSVRLKSPWKGRNSGTIQSVDEIFTPGAHLIMRKTGAYLHKGREGLDQLICH